MKPRAFRLFAALGVALIGAAVLVWLALAAWRPGAQAASGPKPDRPHIKPTAFALAGRYRTDDARMKGATLDVYADHTFSFTAASGATGRGTWTLELDYVGYWHLILNYSGPTPELAGPINRPIHGKEPPYSIAFFADGQAREATVVFRKVDTPPRPPADASPSPGESPAGATGAPLDCLREEGDHPVRRRQADTR